MSMWPDEVMYYGLTDTVLDDCTLNLCAIYIHE